MTPERLRELIDRFPAARIAVVGDFFLDKYLDSDPAIVEQSVETGRAAHQVVAVRKSPGAAGTAVRNLAALDTGTLHAIGAIGDDGEGYDLRSELKRIQCHTTRLESFESLMTPCYLKPRNVTVAGLVGEYDRFDTRNRGPMSPDIVARIVNSIHDLLPDVDAVVVSDQVHEDGWGTITQRVRDVLADQARRSPNVVFWVDSRRHIRKFRNTIVKPNQFEAVGNLDPGPGDETPFDDLRAAVASVRVEVGAPVCITRAHHGALISEPHPTVVPGVRLDGDVDSTGAGDSFTAGAVLTLVSGGSLAEAALVGNLVASLTVQQLATTGTASREQLAERLGVWRTQRC